MSDWSRIEVDADLRIVQKYTEGYHRLFPEADQVVIRSVKWSLWWTNSRRVRVQDMNRPHFEVYEIIQNAALEPVVDLLRARGIHSFHEPSSRVILHVMSNGSVTSPLPNWQISHRKYH